MKGRAKQFRKQVQPAMRKILFGIPSTGMIHMDTMLSVIGILKSTPYAEFLIQKRTSCYVEWNRSELLRIAIENGCSKAFFLDSDMIVEPGVVNKLLALNKSIVGAAYNSRNPIIETKPDGTQTIGIMSNVKMTNEQGERMSVPASEIPKKPFACAGVPTGCMLIDIAALQKIPRPWFDLTYYEDGSLNFGEDIYFCDKAIKHGVEVWCDPTIDIKHIGTFHY